MFEYGAGSLQQVINRLKNADNEEGFQNAVSGLKRYLKELNLKPEILLEVERRAYYLCSAG